MCGKHISEVIKTGEYILGGREDERTIQFTVILCPVFPYYMKEKRSAVDVQHATRYVRNQL